jgi:hypothetical protein
MMVFMELNSSEFEHCWLLLTVDLGFYDF